MGLGGVLQKKMWAQCLPLVLSSKAQILRSMVLVLEVRGQRPWLQLCLLAVALSFEINGC